MTENEFEQRQRERKANKIVAYVRAQPAGERGNLNAEQLEQMTEGERRDIAWCAGVRPASDETWALVVRIVRARDQAATEDPWKGLQ